MIGFIVPGGGELILGLACGLGVWFLAIWLAVRRLQKKLGADARPTTWTYINELGGYIVVGIIIIVSLLVTLVQKLLT